ncbi:glycosyltransferase family 2 protein [bacterium]|nr:glycosyltransferase family 2 protein [bacterium]
MSTYKTDNILIFENLNDTDLREVCIKTVIKNPKVSIIIPAYNTEKYIAKCLISLVHQTLKEIEIIIVDDGSTDKTAEIIKKFASNDSRIKVLSQDNLKQGAARNNGTSLATGEYIGFVDSDDWVDFDFYEKLYNAAKKYNSDIALATNIRIGNGKTKKRLNIKKEEFVVSLQDKIDISRQIKNPCPTNKIYRREMLSENKITWPENMYCEDKLFTIQAIYYSNGLVAVPNVNYYYFRNPNSTVNTKAKKSLIDSIGDRDKAKKSVVEFLRSKKVHLENKDLWAVKKRYKFFGITIYKILEGLYIEKHLLFSFIKIREVKLNNV